MSSVWHAPAGSFQTERRARRRLRALRGGLAPLPEREQYLQQVGVVNRAVLVQVVAIVARLPEAEQHAEQVSVVDAAVAVDVAHRIAPPVVVVAHRLTPVLYRVPLALVPFGWSP
jgi:hypothetical protein